MALTKASRSMLNPGISDSSDATALTFSSSEDATFAGHVSLGDSKKIKLGTSGDLEIYHDGTHSYLCPCYPDDSACQLVSYTCQDISLD